MVRARDTILPQSWTPSSLLHVRFQHNSLHQPLHLPPAGHSWPGGSPRLDLHPLLCHVRHSRLGELHHPVHSEEKAEPPWANVLFPLQAGRHRPGPVYVHPPQNAEHLLVQFQGNRFQCLPHPDVLPSLLFVVESGIFVAMALDRYMAICHPLRHSTILTNPVVAKIGLAVVLRGGMLTLPSILLARQWPYCRTNIIPHTHCEHLAVVKLACADTSVSSYYGLFVVFCVMGLDMIFITMSYTQILRALFSLPTKDARLKIFGTCSSHLSAILAFYIPGLFSFLMYHFGLNLPLHFHILIANMYLLVPPMINPIIYGVRTKQNRDRLLQLITHKGT
ncbi:unnamed protein product, partial [Eretmochelys imbricata]